MLLDGFKTNSVYHEDTDSLYMKGNIWINEIKQVNPITLTGAN